MPQVARGEDMTAIIEFLLSIINIFKCWEILDAYEKGVMLRFGKYKKTLDAGIHFMLPFYIDQVLSDNVVPTTDKLWQQSLETADKKSIVITSIIFWKIIDIKKILLEVEDSDSVLESIAYSVISEQVSMQNWEYIQSDEFADDCNDAINCQAKKYGIEVLKTCFIDKAMITSIRLLGIGS